MHLWHLRPGIPLYYSRGGDELVTLTWVKAIIDDGWYLTVTHLGAPYGMSFGDFPVPSLLHLMVLRFLTLFVHNAGAAVNVYYLLGFPLIALASLYVLRRLGLSWATSMVTSVVYAFLPTRFMRNEAHLFYAQFYLTPILVLAIVWIFRSHSLFDSTKRRPTSDGYIFILGLIAVAWDNEYNAVFAMLLLSLAAVASFVRTRRWQPAIMAMFGIAAIFVAVEVELLPTTIYRWQHGSNAAALVRPAQGSEVYALTLAQLVLPIQSHRIASLAAERAYFDGGLPELINENSSASLGFLGAIGFLASLAALLLIRGRKAGELWPDLARINLAAFLLTTIGGIGALISYYFVPELRAYNRISPLIGFVSLATVAIGLEMIRRTWLTRASSDRLWYGGLLVLAIAGIFDQTTGAYVPAYAADRQAFLADNSFASTLEKRLPANAAIYQIPHVIFPESPPVVQLGSWDQTALYLHSRALRYSFGATRGRAFDTWELQTDGMFPRDFVTRLLLGGFDGVAVYRSGYVDHGAAEENALAAELGRAPLISDDGSIAFFDLSNLRRSYVSRVGAMTAQRIATAVLEPGAALSFGDGFYGLETEGNQHWHWASSVASLVVNNSSQAAIPLRLKILAATARPDTANLRVRAPGSPVQTTTIDIGGKRVVYDFVAPPGTSTITLDTNAKPLAAAGDQRDLRFRLRDWDLNQAEVSEATDDVGRILDVVERLAVPNVAVSFDRGCYGQENGAGRSWHWCSEDASVTLHNDSRSSKTAELQFSLVTGEPADVAVRIGGRTWRLRATPQGSTIKQIIQLPEGSTTLQIRTQAKPIVAPGDPRHMVLQVANLSLTEVNKRARPR